MQGTLLQVFVVTLGLIMHPWDDPGLDEPYGSVLPKPEEWLLREADQEIAPVDEEVARADDKGPLNDVKNIHNEQKDAPVSEEFDQHFTEEEKLPDATGSDQGSEEYADSSGLPEMTESDTDLKTGVTHEDQTDAPTVKDSSQLDNKMSSSKQQKASLSHLHTKTSENEISETAVADWEKDYLWYIWNTLSIISLIRFFRKCLRRNSQMKQTAARNVPVLLPDSDTLQRFHSKYIQVSLNKWKEGEFLEGFASDLVESMKGVCNKNGGMMIEDFQMLDGCNIIVPFTPPEPYRFQCLPCNDQGIDLLPNTQVCGQIKLVENEKTPNGCPCQSSDEADDVVCLLHNRNESVKTEIMDVCNGPLCMKNSPFLSKSQVTRWFQSTIRESWTVISHKYEFELSIRYIDSPGALVVRFRSGKKISFNLNPVVKFNSDAHFYITPCSPNSLDTFWTLSLTVYEDRFIECISKRLPENSCHIQTLDIACFLHRRQTALSGSSFLKDFHFKTALMHLLLAKDPSQWKPNHLSHRLQDLLDFIQGSLEKKLLHHMLIGTPLTQSVKLPAELTHAKPVNLFHPLVVHNCIYKNAVMHFQETLKNADLLLRDYI